MPTSDGRRPARVAARVRDRLSAMLGRELEDPGLAGVSITHVEVQPDLSTARIAVRLIAGDDQPSRRKLLAALERASSRLRRALAADLGLRRTPALEFRYDTGPDASRRVEDLLDEIARERPAEQEPDESTS